MHYIYITISFRDHFSPFVCITFGRNFFMLSKCVHIYKNFGHQKKTNFFLTILTVVTRLSLLKEPLYHHTKNDLLMKQQCCYLLNRHTRHALERQSANKTLEKIYLSFCHRISFQKNIRNYFFALLNHLLKMLDFERRLQLLCCALIVSLFVLSRALNCLSQNASYQMHFSGFLQYTLKGDFDHFI